MHSFSPHLQRRSTLRFPFSFLLLISTLAALTSINCSETKRFGLSYVGTSAEVPTSTISSESSSTSASLSLASTTSANLDAVSTATGSTHKHSSPHLNAAHKSRPKLKKSSIHANETFIRLARGAILDSQRAAWEQGTAAQALLEHDFPTWSVFSKAKMYSGRPKPTQVARFGFRSVAAQDSVGRLCARVTGDENTKQGSSLDSASCGTAVLIGAVMNGSHPDDNHHHAPGGSWGRLMRGAKRELNYLRHDVPRSRSGYLSHRAVGVQAWSDSLYMGPPFLATYGLVTDNKRDLEFAYDQIRLYRKALRKTSGSGKNLWKHIVEDGTQYEASGAWATGQGWVTGGMLRVLAAIAQSSHSHHLKSEKKHLVEWIEEVLDAAYPHFSEKHRLFHNYLDQPSSFYDAAGSMMIAASTFRLASMHPSSRVTRHLEHAESIYKRVSSRLDWLSNFTRGTHVVGVLSFDSPGLPSVEAYSFMLILEAARRDWAHGRSISAGV